MNPQRFKQVEDEYFRLKGLLAAGRLNRQQFEQALAQLIIEDEQGLRWMIGVDDAKWYVQDGSTWVQALPPSGPTPVARVIGTPAPLPRQGSRIPVIILGTIIVLGCFCGGLSIWFVLSQGWLRIGTARPPTALILPTPYSMPTPYVLPTPYVMPTPFIAPLPPPTQPPVPTSPAPSSIPPTLAPSTTPTPTETPTPTVTPTPTATLTPTVAETPGLYVTAVRLNPGPKRGVDIGFYPMFLNTTGGTQNYRVKVYLYRPDNLRNSFGETSAGIIPIPVGPTEQSVPGSWRLSGGGGCEDFIVRVGWIDDVNRITFFNKPDGRMFEQLAAICP